MDKPVTQSFGATHLKSFTKGAVLGPTVIISMSTDMPIMVEFPVESFGTLRYYLVSLGGRCIPEIHVKNKYTQVRVTGIELVYSCVSRFYPGWP